MVKKLIFILALMVSMSTFATSPNSTTYITEQQCMDVYNPSTHTNYKNKPVLIVTSTRGSGPAHNARVALPKYLANNNPGVEIVFVWHEDKTEDGRSAALDWIDRMDIAATGQRQQKYTTPILYFVNTDGTVARFVGFSDDYLNGNTEEAKKFRRLISNLR